jgi:hypothetical protein
MNRVRVVPVAIWFVATFAVLSSMSSAYQAGPSAHDPGWEDTRRTDVDFNKDGTDDFCRLIGGGAGAIPYYAACNLNSAGGAQTFWYQSISDAGYEHSRRFVDWDGDGYIDYCRIVGSGPKFMRCSFGDGKRLGGDFDSQPFDTGFHDANVTWKETPTGATFCADAGHNHEKRSCLPSKKKGFGRPTLTDKN